MVIRSFSIWNGTEHRASDILIIPNNTENLFIYIPLCSNLLKSLIKLYYLVILCRNLLNPWLLAELVAITLYSEFYTLSLIKKPNILFSSPKLHLIPQPNRLRITSIPTRTTSIPTLLHINNKPLYSIWH